MRISATLCSPCDTCIVCGCNNVWQTGIMLVTCREEASGEQIPPQAAAVPAVAAAALVASSV